jgi:hypothetical protein
VAPSLSGDTPAGQAATATQERGSGGGGVANGGMSSVRDEAKKADRVTAVIGPGQLSYPARLERKWPKVP